MNNQFIRSLTFAYSAALEDEAARGKIARLIRDEASKDFPTPGVSGDPTCEDCGEYLGSAKCCILIKAKQLLDTECPRPIDLFDCVGFIRGATNSQIAAIKMAIVDRLSEDRNPIQ